VAWTWLRCLPCRQFVETRAGRTWNCFNSDKVAEVSYASEYLAVLELPSTDIATAIQGKDCLVQKFRNSSVMLEDREFRPKVSSFHALPPRPRTDGIAFPHRHGSRRWFRGSLPGPGQPFKDASQY
jgi:hypothetical protein